MRYALYFTPDDGDPLTVAAETWLGRSVFTGEAVEQVAPAGISPVEFRQWTAEPRRYGFHATLVAPFHLREGFDEAAVRRAAESFAAACSPFDIPRLTLSRIASFHALVPAARCPDIDTLASAAVDRFNGLRAPLTPAEIERRRPERLTARQRAYLERLGYPCVKEEYRFHMTLTGSLEPEQSSRIEPALQAHFATVLRQPVRFGSVALFVEPSPGADFLVHSIHRLGAAMARKTA